ncbi:polypyrimidine tract-binding protein 2 isoform X4 [Octopus bimaculoides]|uniref:polypyrimidine tract-binding protein 2 isoform X4 n=1 Tax=Octopus bimaculoides TaxID=37653 RepID=UPI00071DD594|nr:polypyrimidine tract-binding protein 2 isoform X4 [Octopus bimaculoides]|eukprot:XP_014785757.1 PREDICTED: polypyrimidine tract-binding protein 1-like isoform X4 [Octopus bimaculoides]
MYLCWYPTYNQAPLHVPPVQPLPTLPAPGPPPPPSEIILPLQFATEQIFPVSRKRGSEELMSHSPMVTNGTGMSPHHVDSADMNNDAKKVKLEQSQAATVSKVVHLRGLPIEASDQDVIPLGIPFGRITNFLLLKQKNQAFMEFSDERQAESMVLYYTNDKPRVRNKDVYVQFSNHKELKIDVAHPYQNTNTQAALQAAQAIMGSPEEMNKTILRVIIDNMVFQINIDILYQIFCKFGTIQKIITFTKNNTYQAVIQFSDPVSARSARMTLDGQNIYNGCCTMRIDYSKMTSLNVKYNNEKSRDYTNPSLPAGDASVDQALTFAVPGLGTAPLTTFGAAPGTTLLSDPSQQYIGADMQICTSAPGVGPPAVPMSGFGLTAAGMGAARLSMPLQSQAGNCVLLVSNLDEEMVTPDVLFTLFGVYGDVQRVKILFNKKDNALVQMAEPHHAQLAKTYLDKLTLYGKQIRVAPSKHTVVQMPKEGQQVDSGLTRDYTNSPLHRFKRPGSKNCQNIFPPSAVLHLSNIPSNVPEEQLKDMFAEYGTVKGFKFFPKDRKMALIQMGSIEEAVKALICLHNYPLSESNHLRVSFSKSTI